MTDTGFSIGHYTDKKSITGCTVLLCPEGNRTSCYISGAAPGSRETALLAPEKKIQSVQAILLTGGSAFGLSAAQGVVQYLAEEKAGYVTRFGTIPIVPAAVVYDLNIGDATIRPTAENAYQACRSASPDKINWHGSVGAGTGVTVGKWAGIEKAMKGGLGVAEITVADAWIRAIAVVNAVGDVIDEQGKIVAGAWAENQGFLADNDPGKRWKLPEVGIMENTVLSIVMTNVRLDKLQTFLLAQRAHNGYARAIIPTNTSYDGDIIFAVSSCRIEFTPDIVFDMAAEVVRRAIIDAVINAESLGGVRSYKSN